MPWKVKRDENGDVVFKGDHPLYEDENGNVMTSEPDTWIYKINDVKRKLTNKAQTPPPPKNEDEDPFKSFIKDLGIEDVEDLREIVEAGKSALENPNAKPPQKNENVDILVKRSIAEAKKDWARQQRVIEQERDRLANEAKALKDEREELFGALENQMIDAQGAIAIGERKGRTKLLMKHIKGAVKVVKDEQEGFIPVILDGNGQMRMKGDKRFSIGDLVDEMREDPDFAIAFDADGYRGSATEERGAGGGRAKVVSTTRPGRVSVGDRDGFNNSLEDIAAGKVRVVD